MNEDLITLGILFFIISLFYSSAGFGGGSSYLAVLALTSLSFPVIRSTALICNIIVVSGGTYLFARHKHIPWKKSLPLIIASIPMAFLGGQWPSEDKVFYILLGFSLLVAAIAILFQTFSKPLKEQREMKLAPSAAVGGGIGFLSGLVGIGGGIFLAPVLHLMKWADAKQIAATASLFILLNSISGLLGQMYRYSASFDWQLTLPLGVAVLLGGQSGSRLTIKHLNLATVKRVTGILILVASFKILWDHLG